jgi:tetratricopeptide (TPR) repeat protein
MMATPPQNRLAKIQVLIQQNQLPSAETELKQLLTDNPSDLTGLTLMGVVSFKLGRIDEAESLLLRAQAISPNRVETIGFLAVIARTKNDVPSALRYFQDLGRLGRESPDLLNQIGSCHMELDDPVSAGQAYKHAIELDRNSAHSFYNLGMALKRAGKSYETFLTFKRAIELNPSFLDSYLQLWQQMRQLQNWSDGVAILESGLKRIPTSVNLMVCLASSYGKVGKLDLAENLYRQAYGLSKTAGAPYAHWLQEEGRFEESVPILEEVILENPVQGQAYYNLAVAKHFSSNGKPLLDWMTPLIDRPELNEEEQMFLHYALAKTYEDQKNHELAMHHFDAANDLAYRIFNSNISHDERAVDTDLATLANLYSREFLDRLSPFGSENSSPIFIVGMIRTGTTLLDQILSSHPKVKSAGEQPFWQISAGRVNRRWVEGGSDPKDLRQLEVDYIKVLNLATGGAEKMTDKMPTNFSHIGLMSLAFPKAKFIHIRRNPIDTCLSIYTTFLGSGTQFAYSKENIVGYYRTYFRTMEHWRSVISPSQMIEIDYEDLVTNKEIVLREVLEFCGLEWDDACLNHEQNVSQVSTPSLWTARQPVNTASVERWRKYEPWLGKLLELKDVKHPEPVRASHITQL